VKVYQRFNGLVLFVDRYLDLRKPENRAESGWTSQLCNILIIQRLIHFKIWGGGMLRSTAFDFPDPLHTFTRNIRKLKTGGGVCKIFTHFY
jgi:hypothetical protein